MHKIALLATISSLAAVPAVGLAKSLSYESGHYAGKTRQVNPSNVSPPGVHPSISFAASKRQVSHLVFGWYAPCASGQGRDVASPRTSFSGSGPLTHGKFSGTEPGSLSVGPGYMAKLTYSFAGHYVKQNKVSGTLKVSGHVYDPKGNSVDTCSSGTVGWTATRK